MHLRQWIGIAVAGLLLVAATPAQAAPSAAELKALFLLRFTNYVTWPESETEQPFRFCTIGGPEVQQTLEAIAVRESAEGRSLEVDALDSVNTTTDCDLVYVGSESEIPVAKVAPVFEGRPTLLVGDEGSTIEAGAAIGFTVVEGRVRFEINTTALDDASLKVSSHLLKLALVVVP